MTTRSWVDGHGFTEHTVEEGTAITLDGLVHGQVDDGWNAMGIHQTELAQHNDGLADVEILHVDVHGGGNGVDGADQKHLEENLQQFN